MDALTRITAAQRKDWRTLPTSDWNTLTFTVYIAEMNRAVFGVDEYLPMRNWRFEQGVIKRAIDAHGTLILRAAFDEAFRTYTPTREYPYLTAGFAINYVINRIIPKIKAEIAAKEREDNAPVTDYTAIKDWL